MIKYIHSLFLQSNYEDMLHVKDCICMKHKLYKDYWILYATENFDLESQIDLLEWSNSVLSNIKEAEKNTTLLILWKLDNDKIDVNITNKIIEIENDRFYFKKYVLVYNQICLDAYKKLNIDNIQEALMSNINFEKLKEESAKNGFGAYHLLYSIAHKLPFLMTSVTHKDPSLYNDTFKPTNLNERELYNWVTSIKLEDIEEYINEQINNNNETV